MNPIFVTSEGRVLSLDKPTTPEVKEVKEEPFHIRAAKEAAAQSTPLRK
jgi:hypothetical protein